MLHECYKLKNLAQWHLKYLAEGLVLKSEKVKEGRGTKNGRITSADVVGFIFTINTHFMASPNTGLAVPVQCFKGKVINLCLKTLFTQNVQNCASMERSRWLPFNYELT